MFGEVQRGREREEKKTEGMPKEGRGGGVEMGNRFGATDSFGSISDLFGRSLIFRMGNRWPALDGKKERPP